MPHKPCIDLDQFNQEHQRAVAKYSPELWAKMHPVDMVGALQREVSELSAALWFDDLNSEHGIINEALHVQIVAHRIVEEMRRRHNG